MRISELARGTDLAEPVRHLGRWRIRDVVAHLGGVHRWTTRIVTERSMAGPGFKKSKLDGTDLCDWFDAGAQDLLAVLRSANFTDVCPNFNPGSEPTVAWWARRQAHETTVHRWDVEKALDCTKRIEPSIAVDGVDEFLDVFVRTRGKQTLASPLILRTTRPQRAWTLMPANRSGRIDVFTGDDNDSTAAVGDVTGPPEGLLLALWGRCSATEAGLTITGDPIAAASLLRL